MAHYIRSAWVPDFWQLPDKVKAFKYVELFADDLSAFQHNWPDLQDYQNLLDHLGDSLTSNSGARLKIVPQSEKPKLFEENYAPRIYLTGEIQTRTENWHDFFQLITWLLFPKTKAIINELQYNAAKNRYNANTSLARRSTTENILSRFDECGVILITKNQSTTKLILEHQWKTLFWQQRQQLESNLNCVVFGHAMYEKLFNPYVGMTGNGIFIYSHTNFLSQSLAEQVSFIDEATANVLSQKIKASPPLKLSPFPLLGMPDWYQDNEYEMFYDDSSYFRIKNM